MKDSKRLQKAVSSFRVNVKKYILAEYGEDTFHHIYGNIKATKDANKLCVEYYLGGNTVPFTAGQIVDYVRSKFK
jgi:hypothetical protein|tara:strand:- start:606 stop:830 length:225 start_codon:yes stop_codon:yes gene_type:complete